MIFQLVLRGQINLLEGIVIIRLWFWRVLALEFLGWGVIFAFTAAAFTMGVGLFTLIIVGIASLIWNLTTAALLPVALADPRPFGESLRHGLDVSLAGMRKWASLVVVQMLLLGWATFVHVSYTTREEKHSNRTYTESGLNSESSRSETADSVTTTQHTSTNWSVNSFWTGSYADNCKWHEHLMKALGAPPLLLIDSLLTLLFALLAITIKFRIINDVYRPRPTSKMKSILGSTFGERELCDAEVRYTERVFDGT